MNDLTFPIIYKSTFKKKKMNSSQTTSSNTAKRVRFGGESSVRSGSRRSRKDLWFQPDELNQMKRSAAKHAGRIRGEIKRGKIQGNEIPVSYEKVLLRIYRSCLEGQRHSFADQEKLEHWVSLGHARRGLERYVVDVIAQERSERRFQLQRSIFFVQEKCRNQGLSEVQEAGLIRLASEKLSKPSVAFAKVLAEADAIAAGSNLDDSHIFDMASSLSSKLCCENRPHSVSTSRLNAASYRTTRSSF